jgi:hypothetical protein
LKPYVCTSPLGFGCPVTVRTVVYVLEPSARVCRVKSTGKPAVPPPPAGVSVRGKRRTASRPFAYAVAWLVASAVAGSVSFTGSVSVWREARLSRAVRQA